MADAALQAIVADNIRHFARERSLSLNHLADFAGISRAQLYNFLSGQHDITLGFLAKIAEALEIRPEALLTPRKV